MKKQNGFTLIETLVAVTLVMTLSAAGVYGWQRWQQAQRLWQTAAQVRDYLVFLRHDANRHNRDHHLSLQQEGEKRCLMSAAASGCREDGPFVFQPLWPEVILGEITPAMGFYGLNNTAWPGHIRVQSPAGAWLIVISNVGRIRMCNTEGVHPCR